MPASLAGPLAHILGAPLTRRDPLRPADAIVILGAPVSPSGRVSDLLEERLQAGLALWRRGAAPLVLVTGGAVSTGSSEHTEADAMAARLYQLGLPERALRRERASRSTADNARLCAPLLSAEGCRRVWLVSQPFHLRRAHYLFRRQGFEPLCWSAHDSLQYRAPRRALRWIVREYGAIGLAAWRRARGQL
ncbi:MAG: hypothetical protein Tsb0020_09500 [Haliangiales bacterium]